MRFITILLILKNASELNFSGFCIRRFTIIIWSSPKEYHLLLSYIFWYDTDLFFLRLPLTLLRILGKLYKSTKPQPKPIWSESNNGKVTLSDEVGTENNILDFEVINNT